MKLTKGTKRKLFKLLQMIIGIAALKILDVVSDGGESGSIMLIFKILLAGYVIYMAVGLLYGSGSTWFPGKEEEEHQKKIQ